MVKIFISTPCYGGVCHDLYGESIINLHIELLKKGHKMLFDTIDTESLVHRARNISVARFIQKTDADYFMFIDSDIHFNPIYVIDMIESGNDVSVGCYPKKGIMWEQGKTAIKNGNVIKSINMLASSLVVNIECKTKISRDDKYTEVLDGPTGFMIIKRYVFLNMIEKYPELFCVHDGPNSDIPSYYAVFDCMIDPDSRRYLSEDYAFCRRWQQLGGKIYSYNMTFLGHIGNIPFHGSLYERLKVGDQLNNTYEFKNSCDNS